MKQSWVVLFLLIAISNSGCVVGPNYRQPGESMPGDYDAGVAPLPTTATSARLTGRPATRTPVDITLWWKSLGDSEIDALVERAVQANLDLRIALARLQEARIAEYVVTGGTLPLVDVAAGAGRGTGSDSTRGRIPQPLHSAANTSGLHEITEVAGFDALWEIDLFGRFSRLIEATRADSQAAAELRNDVLITVVSDVVRTYVNARSEQLRLAITLDNLQTARQTYELVNTRFNQGLTNELDVQLSRRQLATVESEVAPLQASIAQAQRRIGVLLGLPPQDLYSELQAAQPIPTPPERIAAGLPLELLRRRPDIREAERRLAAATARIGVATADLFPRVDLVGSFGVQGQGLGRTPVESKSIWSFGPSAYWPVLDFGTIDAIVQVQNYRTREVAL